MLDPEQLATALLAVDYKPITEAYKDNPDEMVKACLTAWSTALINYLKEHIEVKTKDVECSVRYRSEFQSGSLVQVVDKVIVSQDTTII